MISQHHSEHTNCTSIVGFVKVKFNSFNERERVDAAGALWRSDVDLPVMCVAVWRHLRPQDGHVTQFEVNLQVLWATHRKYPVNQWVKTVNISVSL